MILMLWILTKANLSARLTRVPLYSLNPCCLTTQKLESLWRTASSTRPHHSRNKVDFPKEEKTRSPRGKNLQIIQSLSPYDKVMFKCPVLSLMLQSRKLEPGSHHSTRMDASIYVSKIWNEVSSTIKVRPRSKFPTSNIKMERAVSPCYKSINNQLLEGGVKSYCHFLLRAEYCQFIYVKSIIQGLSRSKWLIPTNVPLQLWSPSTNPCAI